MTPRKALKEVIAELLLDKTDALAYEEMEYICNAILDVLEENVWILNQLIANWDNEET